MKNIAKAWAIVIMTGAVLLVGCGDNKEDAAIKAVRDFVAQNDNGTTKLTDFQFYPDINNSSQKTSGYVCATITSPDKDGDNVSYPFYSHVSISNGKSVVTDAHAVFSSDKKSADLLKDRCQKV